MQEGKEGKIEVGAYLQLTSGLSLSAISSGSFQQMAQAAWVPVQIQKTWMSKVSKGLLFSAHCGYQKAWTDCSMFAWSDSKEAGPVPVTLKLRGAVFLGLGEGGQVSIY